MDCSTPAFPVLHYLPEFVQTHVHWVSDTIQPSHPLPPPSPLAFNLSQHQGLFQWVSSLEKTLESPLDCKEIKSVHPKGDQPWTFIGRTDAEADSPTLWPPDSKKRAESFISLLSSFSSPHAHASGFPPSSSAGARAGEEGCPFLVEEGILEKLPESQILLQRKVSQLSILEEREEEENTEQKGAGGRSPEERLSRRSRETKWELLLHQSQGSGFPILQLEPAGESTQRQSPCDDFTGRHHCAVPQVPPSGPLCTKPPPCSPALLSIQPHCGPHGWTQT